jgi:hypothetical protein
MTRSFAHIFAALLLAAGLAAASQTVRAQSLNFSGG